MSVGIAVDVVGSRVHGFGVEASLMQRPANRTWNVGGERTCMKTTEKFGSDPDSTVKSSTPSLKRARTNELCFYTCSSESMSSSLPDLRVCCPDRRPGTPPIYISDKRKVDLRLPSFKDLGLHHERHDPAEHVGPEIELHTPDGSMGTRLKPTAPHNYGAMPLLTPPDEFAPLRSTSRAVYNVARTSVSSASQGEPLGSGLVVSESSSGTHPLGITLPATLAATDASQLSGYPVVARASQTILAVLGQTHPLHQLQLISQTMPSQAKDGRSKPTFEDVLETLQDGIETSPFITITHAVPQVRVMEELPKTPPSTPNAMREINDYFGGDQTIFTHAAVVPIYHNHGRVDSSLTSRFPHHIAAPYSIQVSILERYIPPTMPAEVNDFFSLSSKSYLADRLSELSANNGSLLLVYPTKTGGKTFARKYVGPILDPLLRQFILLNNLTSDAASKMGVMTAIDEMLEFDEMKRRIVEMCYLLTQRPAVRGHKSKYSITHHETAKVVLDRPTWMNWYIEQEQPRLRQNLVEYHQAGGRMPGAQGNQEITTGMLTREVIADLQKSKEPAGGADIEVGVFVVTRSML